VAETFEADRFRKLADRYRKGVQRTQRYSLLTSPSARCFGGAVLVLILVVGTQLALRQAACAPPEVLIAFIVVALRLMSPVKSVANYPTAMAGALAAADRVFEVLDLSSAEGDRPGEVPAPVRAAHRVSGRVLLLQRARRPCSRASDFRGAARQVVGGVGPSGGGQDDAGGPAAAVLRAEGAVTSWWTAFPSAGFTRSSLRGLMGIVSQETILLNDTVLANISYGRQDFTFEQVQAAARAANAHDFVSQLTDGLPDATGERGTRLSGGERQRIAIARALLRDPAHPDSGRGDSALDMESERLVQEAIDRLMVHRTAFVIAHRLATVQHADLILVLAEGRIVERGTHATLYAAGGLYRRLHDMQFRT